MTIEELLRTGADPAMALGAPGRAVLSYAALRRHVALIGAALNQAGIGRADRVAIVMPDGPSIATAFLSVASAAIAAPLNPRFTAAELEFYLADLKPRALVVEAQSKSPVVEVAARHGIAVLEIVPGKDAPAGQFELRGAAGTPRLAVAVRPDDCALLLHTSGTTARPKLVPLTHRQLCASARNVARSLQLAPEDRGLHIMPLFHIHGLVAGLLAPLLAGGGVYCTPGLELSSFGDWLADAAPSWLTAVPTMHQAMLDWARRHPQTARQARLRLMRSCSAALAPSVATALEEAFATTVIEAYAMTEAAHQITSNPPTSDARRLGSVGLASGPEVAILGADGAVLAGDEIGEVAIRGENVFAGYLDNPGANADAFCGGWFRTGDLGAIDRDGYLWLKGRLKEMINRGGEKISPIEIENLLLDHPSVSQAVVFAVPHASLGEEAGAAVVLREGAAAGVGDLQAFILSRLSLPKVPRRIAFVDALPKGPTGKLRRIGMAQALGLCGSQRPAFVAPRSPLERAVADIWSGALPATANVGVEDDFFDLGGNSIAALQIASEILKTMGVEVELSQFLRTPTIAALAAAIMERRLLALDPDVAANLLAEVESGEGART